jgi:hypothetical protein
MPAAPSSAPARRAAGADGGGPAAPASADDVTLRRNPHAWSRAAHVLYVDSPAGTGMSYSTDPEVCPVWFGLDPGRRARRSPAGTGMFYLTDPEAGASAGLSSEGAALRGAAHGVALQALDGARAGRAAGRPTQPFTLPTALSTGRSHPKEDYHTDDAQTAEDLLRLLLGVLRDAPDMQGRDVYIAGGMGWDGVGWDGMGWDGMGWDGMGWDGMGWDGMGWGGVGWGGMGWDGVGWDGMGWGGGRRSRLVF